MKYLLLILALTACTTTTPVPTHSTLPVLPITESEVAKSPSPALRTPTAAELAGCPKRGEFQGFDRVGYSDQKFIDVMRYLGMNVAMRYYDWKQESISGKTPTLAEMALYKKNGMPFVGVFQHNNRWARADGTLYNTFNAARGKVDAARVLELAALWKQPKGSAAYFGVDFDSYTTVHRQAVKAYFAALAPIIRGAGLRVGMYGSGGSCEDLAGWGLVDRSHDTGGKPLCWIAASSYGWRGTTAILKSGNYVIAQKVNQKCAGQSIDFDKLNASDVGQW